MNGPCGVLLACLLSVLTLAPSAAGRQATRFEVRVTAPDRSAAGGGVEDASLTGALAQALIDVGLPALRASDYAAPCGDGCLRVLVQRVAEQRFLIEVRASAEAVRTELQLGPASSFDVAHALAIQVEMLADRLLERRKPRARRAPPKTADAAAAKAASPAAASSAPASPDAPRASADIPSTRAPPRRASDPPVAPRLPDDDGLPSRSASPPRFGAAIDDALVGLDVGPVMLTALGRDRLFMFGAAVGARLRMAGSAELRAGIAFLRPQRRRFGGRKYRRELLPLQLALSGHLSALPELRAGAGLEATVVDLEDAGREYPSSWSFGALGRAEYRYAIHRLALLATAQTAFHPAAWRTGPRDSRAGASMPPWTVSVALGMKFTIF